MIKELIRHTRVLEIVGDTIRVKASDVAFGDIAIVENVDGETSIAKVVELDHNIVSLQVFAGGKGLSTGASVRFLGHPLKVTYSNNILGRIFGGSGEPVDDGPDISTDPKINTCGPTVNPMKRVLANKMIHTHVPMIDIFNSLVESQKIPIFSVAGEPYNELLARIGFQADADIVVFAGLGLIFDDYHFFRTQFENHGVFHRTVMFVNQASDPIVERLLVPDMALAVAEKFAVEESKRVLVLMTDMTAYADAMKEIGISLERVPATRGYMPVPDNTGYITEGQLYLHNKMIDPFGSLSRLKQHVIGKVTREDHSQVMNTMIRFYSGAVEAERKQSMAFELSPFDHKLLKFGTLFRKHFMDIKASMPLIEALDYCWKVLAECFNPQELLMKQALVDNYFPEKKESAPCFVNRNIEVV
jgi:V/A-type H+-transporting ATPase subunit B